MEKDRFEDLSTDLRFSPNFLKKDRKKNQLKMLIDQF